MQLIICFEFQASHQPALLAIGTEVSARFNGAFCEAKITKIIVKNVKIKVRELQFPS
jgi:hypothetical protein